MIWIYLVLIVAVFVFGLGVVVLNRRKRQPELLADRTSEIVRPPRPLSPVGPATADPSTTDDTGGGVAAVLNTPDLVEPESGLAETVEPDTVEPEVYERPTFPLADGQGPQRTHGCVPRHQGPGGHHHRDVGRPRRGVRADVGVRVTDELLSGLRARVKSKEIADPDALLVALQAEMTGRLQHSDREPTWCRARPARRTCGCSWG